MQNMREAQIDPLKEYVCEYDEVLDNANENKKGLIIFVHGSPCEGNLSD